MFFLLRRDQIGDRALEHLGREVDRLRQRRVGVDRVAQIDRIDAHLDRQRRLGDQVARIGANDAGYLLKAMALSSFVFFVPAVFVTVGWLDMGIVGTWLAYDLFMIGRFVTLLPGYRGDKWQRSIVST